MGIKKKKSIEQIRSAHPVEKVEFFKGMLHGSDCSIEKDGMEKAKNIKQYSKKMGWKKHIFQQYKKADFVSDQNYIHMFDCIMILTDIERKEIECESAKRY